MTPRKTKEKSTISKSTNNIDNDGSKRERKPINMVLWKF